MGVLAGLQHDEWFRCGWEGLEGLPDAVLLGCRWSRWHRLGTGPWWYGCTFWDTSTKPASQFNANRCTDEPLARAVSTPQVLSIDEESIQLLSIPVHTHV